MNDVGAAPSLPDGVQNHLLPDQPRRDGHTSPPPPPVFSPPTLNGDRHKTPNASAVGDEGASGKADSEAETIIQCGQEELSPEKKKTHVQHTVGRCEERRNDDDDGHNDNAKTMAAIATDDWNARKRRRVEEYGTNGEQPTDGRSRSSSRPSSKRSSPSRQMKQEKSEDSPVRSITRESSSGDPAIPRTTNARKSLSRDRTTRVEEEGVVRREAHQHASDASRNDEPEEANSSYNNNHNNRINNNNNISYAPRASNDRSTSPVIPFHKRTSSGSLPSSIRRQKKKRAPPPLLTDHSRHRSEDRDSNSSRSGSPLTTARGRSGDYFGASSAKHPGMRRRDQNGRTRLARACAAQEVEAAKDFHANQPDDLNIPDNAGNTPLQIASLEGCLDLVKYLLDAGCDISTKNIDKDTPLIDAVENGHLEVVKLLLGAGVNPRAGNAQGDEPYDLVPSDSESYNEIRHVIKEAKSKATSGIPHRKSEDFAGKDPSSWHDATVTSPHETTQAASARSPPPPPMVASSRRKTVRSEATRNDLLWTSATPENLRHFAAKGDMAGVATILNVLPKADNESLIAAAKGGHDEVLGLLLGLGEHDPDPGPMRSGNHKPGYNTPMLAAIGRGNTQVIRLLLDQPGFDPTRSGHFGRKYYEISQERKGESWEDEYQLLKDAYDNHTKSPKSRKLDTKSPQLSRDEGRVAKEALRRESPFSSPESIPRKKSVKTSLSSLAKEGTTIKEKKRRPSIEKPNQKPRGKESLHLTTAPDHDAAQHSINRQSLLSVEDKSHEDHISSTHGQEHVKRRRLIPGRPPQDRKGRRASLISSDSHSSREEVRKAKVEESVNESRANRSLSPLKRRRNSMSPEPPQYKERQHREGEIQEHKRRRVRSDEDIFKHSMGDGKAETHRQSLEPGIFDSGHSKHDSMTQRRVSDAAEQEKKSPIKAKSAEDGVLAAEEDRRELDPAPIPSLPTTHAAETEARKAREAKEAEERRLAEEAERVQRDREAKQAEEAREAAERAARAAREKAEEEERKRREAELRRIRQAEEEHQKRLEQERLRQARIRREQEEQEQRRREALPNLLRAAADVVGSNDARAKNHKWLDYFLPLHTVTTGQLDLSCIDPEVKEERWTPNYQVAPLLATNDLQLSQCKVPLLPPDSDSTLADCLTDPSWEKRTATPTQRNNLWRVTGPMLTYSAVLNPLHASVKDYENRYTETIPKYEAMEHVFWVKVRLSKPPAYVLSTLTIAVIAFGFYGLGTSYTSPPWTQASDRSHIP